MTTSLHAGASDTVIANIKTLKQVRGLTNAGIAARMNDTGHKATAASITWLMAGKRARVSYEELVALSDAVGFTLDDLLVPLCRVCSATPPVGYICGRCYELGDGVEGNPTLHHLRDVTAA